MQTSVMTVSLLVDDWFVVWSIDQYSFAQFQTIWRSSIENMQTDMLIKLWQRCLIAPSFGKLCCHDM